MKLKIKDKIILKADESDFENQEHRRDCVNKIVTIKEIFYDDDNNIDTFFVEENKYEWTLENIVNKQETIENIKLEQVLGSTLCKYTVIENKLATIYRNQEQILKAIKMLNKISI